MSPEEPQPFFTKKTIITTIIIGIIIFVCIVIMIIINLQNNQINNSVNNQATQITQETSQKTPAQVNNASLDKYLNILHSVIQNKYGDQLSGYEIAKGNLLNDGTWYITTISQPLEDQWDAAKDAYRIILHQNNGTWEIMTEPKLILNYSDYPNIPTDVIMSANDYNSLNEKY